MINYGAQGVNPLSAFMNTANNFNQLNDQNAQRQAAMKQAEQQAALMQQFQGLDFSDQAGVNSFIKQNPQMLETVKSVAQFGDDAANKQALDAAVSFDRALQSGNQDVIEQTIQSIAPIIDNNGDPSFSSDTVREMVKTPIGIEQLKMMSSGYISQLGGDEYIKQTYLTPQQKQQAAQQGIENNLAERKFNADRSDAQFNRDMKKLEFDIKKAKAQGDPVKLAEAEKKKTEAEYKDQQALSGKVQTTKSNLETVNQLLGNQEFIDDLTGKSGVAQGLGFRPSQDSRDAQILFNNIVSSETLNNLGVMSGPLTDRDIEVIRSASTKLKEGMSEQAMKRELSKMSHAYNRVLKNYEKEANRKGYSMDNEVVEDTVTVSWGDL